MEQGYGRETEAESAVTGSPRRAQSRYMLSDPSKPLFFRNEEQDQVTKSFSNTASKRPVTSLAFGAPPVALHTSRSECNAPSDIAPYTAGEAPKVKQLCADGISAGWGRDAVVGIRSLPNALKPNFRQTLLKQVCVCWCVCV